jgi:competence protein ComEA
VRKPKPFPSASSVTKISSGLISLNKAGMQDLMRLPGVGKATAEKILAAREERKFVRLEDVMRVKGIGKKKFAAMKKFLVL